MKRKIFIEYDEKEQYETKLDKWLHEELRQIGIKAIKDFKSNITIRLKVER